MNKLHTTAIDRRHFLRGLGMALALPAFNSLNTGFAAAAPSATPRRLICIGNHLGFWPGGFFPTTAGLEFAMSKTLAPLQEYRSDFTVFSHLDHDAKGGHGAVHAFLSGVKKAESAGFPEKNMSLDQVAAEHVGSATRYPSITAGIGEGTDMCWNRAGVRLPPVNNPARLFEALFVESGAGAKRIHVIRLRVSRATQCKLSQHGIPILDRNAASTWDKVIQLSSRHFSNQQTRSSYKCLSCFLSVLAHGAVMFERPNTLLSRERGVCFWHEMLACRLFGLRCRVERRALAESIAAFIRRFSSSQRTH